MKIVIDYRTSMSNDGTITVTADGVPGGVSDMPASKLIEVIELVPRNATVTDVRFDPRGDLDDDGGGGL